MEKWSSRDSTREASLLTVTYLMFGSADLVIRSSQRVKQVARQNQWPRARAVEANLVPVPLQRAAVYLLSNTEIDFRKVVVRRLKKFDSGAFFVALDHKTGATETPIASSSSPAIDNPLDMRTGVEVFDLSVWPYFTFDFFQPRGDAMDFIGREPQESR